MPITYVCDRVSKYRREDCPGGRAQGEFERVYDYDPQVRRPTLDGLVDALYREYGLYQEDRPEFGRANGRGQVRSFDVVRHEADDGTPLDSPLRAPEDGRRGRPRVWLARYRFQMEKVTEDGITLHELEACLG